MSGLLTALVPINPLEQAKKVGINPSSLAVQMMLGLFPFMRQTLPYQSIRQTKGWRWAASNRVGRRASRQFLGPDEEPITLAGVLLPEITGGEVSLEALIKMGDQGKAWSLISGSGWFYGMFVMESLEMDRTIFWPNGAARRIEFTLTLKRVDDDQLDTLSDLADTMKGLV